MNPRTVSVRATLAAALCTATLGFAACGDDEETTSSTTAADTGASGATGDSGSSGSVQDQLRELLITTGLDEKDAGCIVDKVTETASEEDLQDALDKVEESGDTSAANSDELASKFDDAAQDCGLTAQP
jgi:hypothetical protein